MLATLGGCDAASPAQRDARAALQALEGISTAGGLVPGSLDSFLTKVCGEVETCAGRCREPMDFALLVDWSSIDAKGRRELAGKFRREGCPGLAEVLEDLAEGDAKKGVRAYGRERMVAFLRASCERLNAAERRRLSGAASNLGIALGGESCGN